LEDGESKIVRPKTVIKQIDHYYFAVTLVRWTRWVTLQAVYGKVASNDVGLYNRLYHRSNHHDMYRSSASTARFAQATKRTLKQLRWIK